jgi:hypothetical protein
MIVSLLCLDVWGVGSLPCCRFHSCYEMSAELLWLQQNFYLQVLNEILLRRGCSRPCVVCSVRSRVV